MNNKSVGVNSIANTYNKDIVAIYHYTKTDINILISFVVDNPFYFEKSQL